MSLCENQKTISGTTYPQTQRHKQPNGTHAQAPVSGAWLGHSARTDSFGWRRWWWWRNSRQLSTSRNYSKLLCRNFGKTLLNRGIRAKPGINARFTKSGCRQSVCSNSVRDGGWEGPASQRTSALIKAGGGSSQILPVAIIPEISARQVPLNDFEDGRCRWNAVLLPGRYGDDWQEVREPKINRD